MEPKRILIVDDDAIIRQSLAEFLKLEGYDCRGAGNFDAAISELEKRSVHLLITDVNMPGTDGFELLRVARKRYPEMVTVIITGFGTIESAVEAIKMGAYDYLTKPIVDDEIRMLVSRAMEQQSLLAENRSLKKQLRGKFGMSNIVGADVKMLKVFDLVESVADSKATVLISGPSGTGKSLIARAIHAHSDRMDQPFIEVSCGALSETLLESELFGHVKGAFTGAMDDKHGKFLAADGGTLFLDEINSASVAMQVKLLRVIQEKQFEPVGSNTTHSVNVRLLLASNADLKALVDAGDFRQDLYYRINVVNIDLPPLCQRPSDISLLADRFLRTMCSEHGRVKEGISKAAVSCLESYRWPGNVRELENVIERAVVLSKTPYIEPDDLPEHLRTVAADDSPTGDTPQTLKQALEGPEKRIILEALARHAWNRQATADALGINRTTLYKKLKHYGLDAADTLAVGGP